MLARFLLLSLVCFCSLSQATFLDCLDAVVAPLRNRFQLAGSARWSEVSTFYNPNGWSYRKAQRGECGWRPVRLVEKQTGVCLHIEGNSLVAELYSPEAPGAPVFTVKGELTGSFLRGRVGTVTHFFNGLTPLGNQSELSLGINSLVNQSMDGIAPELFRSVNSAARNALAQWLERSDRAMAYPLYSMDHEFHGIQLEGWADRNGTLDVRDQRRGIYGVIQFSVRDGYGEVRVFSSATRPPFYLRRPLFEFFRQTPSPEHTFELELRSNAFLTELQQWASQAVTLGARYGGEMPVSMRESSYAHWKGWDLQSGIPTPIRLHRNDLVYLRERGYSKRLGGDDPGNVMLYEGPARVLEAYPLPDEGLSVDGGVASERYSLQLPTGTIVYADFSHAGMVPILSRFIRDQIDPLAMQPWNYRSGDLVVDARNGAERTVVEGKRSVHPQRVGGYMVDLLTEDFILENYRHCVPKQYWMPPIPN